jgi:hypothetical protein
MFTQCNNSGTFTVITYKQHKIHFVKLSWKLKLKKNMHWAWNVRVTFTYNSELKQFLFWQIFIITCEQFTTCKQKCISVFMQTFLVHYLMTLSVLTDCLCGLVVRVYSYRSRGPGFDSRSFQIFWEAAGLEQVHSASWGQLRSYLKEK